jgi:hypothetical protein
VPAIGLDQHDGDRPAREPLHAEALVAELAVEALVDAVLPRLAGIVDGAGRGDTLYTLLESAKVSRVEPAAYLAAAVRAADRGEVLLPWQFAAAAAL